MTNNRLRLAMIKKAAQRAEAKRRGITLEEVEMQHILKNMDERKVKIKAEVKAAAKKEKKMHKELTAQVKKAGKQSPGSLEFNSPDNMYYSDKDTKAFLENSSYMDAYNANRSADGDY
jgi:hypothetical protein